MEQSPMLKSDIVLQPAAGVHVAFFREGDGKGMSAAV